jgi:hypothetical protein
MFKKIKEKIGYNNEKKQIADKDHSDSGNNISITQNFYIDKSKNTTNIAKTDINDSVVIRSNVNSSNNPDNLESNKMNNSKNPSGKPLNFSNLYSYLINIAESKQKVSYKQVTDDFEEDFNSKRHHLYSLLDEISEYNKARSEPFLAALVVTKDTKVPGAGFFKKWIDRENYSSEIEAVFNYKWQILEES